MHIIFLGDSICTQNTGIHFYGIQLVNRIIKNLHGHEYSIVFPHYNPEFNIRQIIIPEKRWLPFHLRFRQLITIPRRINKLKPDVVIELAHFGPFFLSLGIKRITVIHDLTPVIHPEFHNILSVLMHRLLLPGILRRTDKIIVNSNNTKSDVIKRYGIRESKIEVVYPKLRAPIVDVQYSKRPLLPAVKRPFFLSVGTIEPRKNQITVIRAFEKFCERNDEYYLVIAGKKGWKNKSFFEYYKGSTYKDKIILTGYISREALWGLYSHAFAFVFASKYEGFGLPVLEAQFFGLPLLLSRIPVMEEVAAYAALYFDPLDSDELSSCMHSIVEDKSLRITLGETSRAMFNKLQSMEHNLASIFD